MTPEAYKEIGDDLESLLRIHRDELNEDERVLRPLKEAFDVCRTRYRDAMEERKKR